MAQASSMGPPQSPRETRRSGRRSAHSGSTSTSKSPDSDPMPRPKESAQRPSLSTNNSGTRSKRLKQEDIDDAVGERKNGTSSSTTSSSSTQAAANGRSRRKKKDRDQDLAADDPMDDEGEEELAPDPDADDDEEQGITRCVCGSTEDDPDAGEFMVQCETCKVWQHGLCMGYESEDQLHDDDYYCEQCRPDLHQELLRRKPPRKARQSSTASHHPANRSSRSHSPSHSRNMTAKRRNTMNSRDAAFDENLKEILETTAAEADASFEPKGDNDDEEREPTTANRKKRKRAEDDAPAKKRPRSASVMSEQHARSVVARSETPIPSAMKTPALSAPLARPPARAKRGGARKSAVTQNDVPAANESGEAAAPAPKRNNGRGKGGTGAKRGQNASATPAIEPRRIQVNGNSSTSAQSHGDSRAYRNSHAYVVSQQPMLTSWHLPDYLAHLENIFPTPHPVPLEVPSSADGGIEISHERGVKTKWPGKRMSVGDMNKRVRALVEWVGREQASTSDRVRRREALESALRDASLEDSPMMLGGERNQSPVPRHSLVSPPERTLGGSSSSSKTMKLMEELMEELICFQEKFGSRRG